MLTSQLSTTPVLLPVPVSPMLAGGALDEAEFFALVAFNFPEAAFDSVLALLAVCRIQ